jgi:hypothetical protein
MRYTICQLAAAIAAIAVGVAALASPTYLWANIVVSLTIGWLLFAIVRASATTRPFWLACAGVGTVYLLFNLPGSVPEAGWNFDQFVMREDDYMILNRALVWVFMKYYHDSERELTGGVVYEQLAHFCAIGSSLFAVLLSLIGGLLGERMKNPA